MIWTKSSLQKCFFLGSPFRLSWVGHNGVPLLRPPGAVAVYFYDILYLYFYLSSPPPLPYMHVTYVTSLYSHVSVYRSVSLPKKIEEANMLDRPFWLSGFLAICAISRLFVCYCLDYFPSTQKECFWFNPWLPLFYSNEDDLENSRLFISDQ